MDNVIEKTKNLIEVFEESDLIKNLDHYKKIEKRGFLVYYKNKELKDYKFTVNLENEEEHGDKV